MGGSSIACIGCLLFRHGHSLHSIVPVKIVPVKPESANGDKGVADGGAHDFTGALLADGQAEDADLTIMPFTTRATHATVCCGATYPARKDRNETETI